MSGKKMKKLRIVAQRIADFKTIQSGIQTPLNGYDIMVSKQALPNTYNVVNGKLVPEQEKHVAQNTQGSLRQIYRHLKKIT